jgi:hypothetical protein
MCNGVLVFYLIVSNFNLDCTISVGTAAEQAFDAQCREGS